MTPFQFWKCIHDWVSHDIFPTCNQKIEEPETIEQQVVAAAVPMEAMRFSVVTNVESDVGEKEKNSNKVTPGEKVSRNIVLQTCTFYSCFHLRFCIL